MEVHSDPRRMANQPFQQPTATPDAHDRELEPGRRGLPSAPPARGSLTATSAVAAERPGR
jgi:hypothetical protein